MAKPNENTPPEQTPPPQPPTPPADPVAPAEDWKPVAGGDCAVFVVLGGPRIVRCPGSIAKVNKDGTVDLEVRLPSGKLERRERVRHRGLSSQGDGFDAP